MRIGTGFDVHRFITGRPLVLGGVTIDHPMGLEGHSDADVLVHAIIDALLGASNLPDIGQLFPDSSSSYKNISSLVLLEKVSALLRDKGISVINLDSTVICDRPKIARYIPDMKKNISEAMIGVSTDRIGIKGTTTEGLGFTGRGEGIAAQAVALVQLTI
ncbi:MAG TPA: 2-C-methyl-D-erythritol 2,4-cyclodiphosphate synthase [Spirochaetota bacterium]|nr:2-C-methyl-D-erythritol 2,4-cyclodiphosphate synthase [Spirochaetota bacterium]